MKKIYTLYCGYTYNWIEKYIKAYPTIEKACIAYLQLLAEFTAKEYYIFDEDENFETVLEEMKNTFNTRQDFEGACEITIEEWEVAE